MPIPDFWWEFEDRFPPEMYGDLAAHEVEELYGMLKG